MNNANPDNDHHPGRAVGHTPDAQKVKGIAIHGGRRPVGHIHEKGKAKDDDAGIVWGPNGHRHFHKAHKKKKINDKRRGDRGVHEANSNRDHGHDVRGPSGHNYDFGKVEDQVVKTTNLPRM